MNKIVVISIIVIVLIVGSFVYFFQFNKDSIKESLKIENRQDTIVVFSPIKDSLVSSPLTISGRARGTWFFEGSFPIELLDAYRNTIAEGHVTAQGEWMTEGFVKFIGNIQFNNYIKGQKGILVLKKDNPTGLVEYDDSVEIPITFK